MATSNVKNVTYYQKDSFMGFLLSMILPSYIFYVILQWVRFIIILYVLKIHQVKTVPSFGNIVTF